MNNNNFEALLKRAIEGDSVAVGEILVLYEPLIRKYSYIYGKFDEDLHQELKWMLIKKVDKFKI